MIHHLFWLLVLLAGFAKANVEKLVFLGPSASKTTIDLPSVSVLTPPQTTIRTQFHSRFDNTPAHPRHIPPEAWFLLADLKHGKRYEVRVCWPATQPTAFDMKLYTLEEITADQKLVESLKAGENIMPSDAGQEIETGTDHEGPRLFLHVKATADYLTMNQTLMKNGLIVDIDIILDEYIWNLAPSSLLHTGLYLIVVGVVAVLVSRLVLQYLDSIVAQGSRTNTAAEKKTS